MDRLFNEGTDAGELAEAVRDSARLLLGRNDPATLIVGALAQLRAGGPDTLDAVSAELDRTRCQALGKSPDDLLPRFTLIVYLRRAADFLADNWCRRGLPSLSEGGQL
jgi:hypothetical protein